jgi:hypothetical protein
VNAGTLITGNISALGNGNVSVTGGTLQIGDGTVNTVTLTGAAALSIGNGALLKLGGYNVLSLDHAAGTNGAITLGTGTYSFNTSGELDLNGMLNESVTGLDFGTHTYNIFAGGAGTGSTDVSSLNITGFDSTVTNPSFANGVLTYTAVPEPGAWVSLLGGCGILMGLRRRRRY